MTGPVTDVDAALSTLLADDTKPDARTVAVAVVSAELATLRRRVELSDLDSAEALVRQEARDDQSRFGRALRAVLADWDRLRASERATPQPVRVPGQPTLLRRPS